MRYGGLVSRRARSSRRGLTLIEIVIALAVLSIAVMSALSGQLTSMQLMVSSRETNIAMSDLQGCMEQLLLVPIDKLPIAGSDFEIGQSIDLYTDLHLSNESIVPAYPGYVAGGTIPDPLPIVLNMNWTDPQGHPRSLNLRSMKTR